jgi:hypothetical protein
VREPVSLPAFERRSEPPRRPRVLLPVLMSLLVVGGLAAIFVYQSGLGGQAASASRQTVVSPPSAPSPAEPPAQPPAASQAMSQQPTPADQPEAKPSPLPSDAPLPSSANDNRPADVPTPQAFAEPEPRETVRIPQTLVPLAHAAHDVWVTTSPPGAKAVLDGNLDQACRTPCMLHGAPGVHQLAVSQAGYLNEYREVRIGDTAVDVPPISLRQPSSTLMVSTNPRGASVKVNGQLMSQVTPAVLTLKPGTYTVTVEKDGFTKTETVRLGEDLVHLSVTLNQ